MVFCENKDVCAICIENVIRKVGEERKVINIRKEEERTQENTLRYITGNYED